MTNLATTASQLETVSNGVAIRNIDDVSRLSRMFAASGFFSDCRDAAQAAVKIMAGQEIGIPPFMAVNGIHIINGKATLGAGIMAGKLKSSPKYNYKVKTHTSVLCVIEIYELINGRMEPIGDSSFSIEEAKKAGSKNLDKYPRNMLFARSISNAIRFHAPDLFLGGPVYTPEEMGAVVNDDGEIVGEVVEMDLSPAPVVPKKSQTKQTELSPARQQINFFRQKTEIPAADLAMMATRLELPPSVEMTNDDAIVLVGEMLSAWAMDQSEKISPEVAQFLVRKSIEATTTDEALWSDFEMRVEAHIADNQ